MLVKARERVAAWIVTGPVGHFWSASADIVALWARYAWHRALGSTARRRRRPAS